MNSRRLALFLASLPLLTVLVLVLRPASQARAQAAEEAGFVTAINELRASRGLQPLAVDTDLRTAARQWAVQMRSNGSISHAPDITAGITRSWQKVGENVGVGPDIPVLMEAFIASPTHYANLVDPLYNHVGVGVAWQGDVMYTTHRFMYVPNHSTTTAAPTVTQPPTTTPPTTATTLAPVTSPPTTRAPIVTQPPTTRRPTTTVRPTTVPPTSPATAAPPTTSTPSSLPTTTVTSTSAPTTTSVAPTTAVSSPSTAPSTTASPATSQPTATTDQASGAVRLRVLLQALSDAGR